MLTTHIHRKFVSAFPEFAGNNNRCYMTIKHQRYCYKLINRYIFDNKLSIANFKTLTKHPKCYAYCFFNGFKFTIYFPRKLRSLTHFIELMSHEMVHVHQILNLETDTHGPSFNKWSDKLAKNNIRLKIYF